MKKLIAACAVILLTTVSLKAQTTARILCVVNNLGETLSLVDIASGRVENDAVTLGNVPNDIAVAENTAYILNSISADINVIDLTGAGRVKNIELIPQSNPWSLRFGGAHTAYVSNTMLHSLSVVDLSGDSLLGNIPVGTGPEGMIVVNGCLFVANTGYDLNTYSFTEQGSVSVIDLQSDSLVATVTVPMNPQALAAGPDGRVYAACSGSSWMGIFGKIAVIDPSGGAGSAPALIDSIEFDGFPNDIAVTPNGKMFIAAGGTWMPGDDGLVFLYDTVNDSLIHGTSNPITTASTTARIIVDEQSGAVFVSCFADDQVQKLDPETGAVLATYDVGDGPMALAAGAGIVTSATGETPVTVDVCRLEQNYPNPFNASTRIECTLPEKSRVRLTVYNLLGQKIRTVADTNLPAGCHAFTWDGRDDYNRTAASGVYIYRLEAGSFQQSRKMLFMK